MTYLYIYYGVHLCNFGVPTPPQPPPSPLVLVENGNYENKTILAAPSTYMLLKRIP